MITPSGAPPFRLRRRPTASPVGQIASVRVRGLFGKLDYPHIPIKVASEPGGRIAVLYGDNGTGKTTILKLIYACLSPQKKSGLRTLVARTPFYEFRIDMSDGSALTVEKNELVGNYKVTITWPSQEEEFRVMLGQDGRVQEQDSIEYLSSALGRIGFDMLFVDHNRVVKSTYSFLSEATYFEDSVYPGLDARELIYASREAGLRAAVSLKESDLQFPLPQVVDALERWFRTQAFRQGAVGEQSAAAVYLEIAKSFKRDRRKGSATAVPQIPDVPATLNDLKLTSESFIRHGLLSEYPFDELVSIYETASKPKRRQIEDVLRPFLDSIQRRMSALKEVHTNITTLELELNKYFRDKKAGFHILEGLQISDHKGQIDLDALSSGEKQLVFLLCAAAVARSRKSVILIDEPELSLNYKWQRLIAGSLSKISSGGETQFILASHSIEIISRYVDSSFELAGEQ